MIVESMRWGHINFILIHIIPGILQSLRFWWLEWATQVSLLRGYNYMARRFEYRLRINREHVVGKESDFTTKFISVHISGWKRLTLKCISRSDLTKYVLGPLFVYNMKNITRHRMKNLTRNKRSTYIFDISNALSVRS